MATASDLFKLAAQPSEGSKTFLDVLQSGQTARSEASAGSEVPSLGELTARAGAIAATAPHLSGAVQHAQNQPSGLKKVAFGLLDLLDKPRQAVQSVLFGDPDGAKEWFSKNVKGDSVWNRLLRGVGTFVVDTLTDPLSYVSFGAGNLGKKVVQEGVWKALAEKTARETAEKAGVTLTKKGADKVLEELATKTGRVVADGTPDVVRLVEEVSELKSLATRVLGGADAAGKPRLSKVYKSLTPEEYAALPAKYRGGVGLALPFGTNRLSVVPATLTSKVSSRTAKVTGLDSRAFNAVANSITTGRRAQDAGIRGYLTVRAKQARDQAIRSMDDSLGEALVQSRHVFNPKDEASTTRFFNALWRPGSVEDLTPDEEAVVDNWRRFFEEKYSQMKNIDGDVGHVDAYAPRVLTDEGKRVLFGEDAGAAWHPAGEFSSAFKKRAFKSFDEMQEFARKEYGVKLLNDDPWEALVTWGRALNRSIANNEFSDTLLKTGLVIDDTKRLLTPSGGRIMGHTLKKAGFENYQHAFQTALRLRRQSDGGVAVTKAGEDLFKVSSKERAAWNRLPAAVRETLDADAALHSQGMAGAVHRKAAKLANASRNVQKHQSKIITSVEGLEQRQVAVVAAQARVADAERRVASLEALRGERKAAKKPTAQVEKQITAARVRVEALKRQVVREQGRVKEAQAVLRDLSKPKKYYELLAKVANAEDELAYVKAGFARKGAKWPGPEPQSAKQVPEGFAQINGTSITALNGKYAPVPIAEEFNKTFRQMDRKGFIQGWDRFIGFFKRWVTVPWPGFHMRNMYGGWFNNFIGGVKNRHYALHVFLERGKHVNGEWVYAVPGDTPLLQYLNAPGVEGLTVGQYRELFKSLTTQGSVLGELDDLAGNAARKGFGSNRVADKIQDAGSRFTKVSEGLLRGAALLSGLEQTGDLAMSRAFTLARHGDYKDLTSVEQNLRRVIPFYKWLRFNTPLQIEAMVSVPGKVLAPVRAVNDILGSEEDEDGLLPSAVGFQAGGFMSRFGKAMAVQLPIFDALEVLGGGPVELVGRAAPPIQLLAETALNRDLFTGQDLSDTVPAVGGFNPLARAMEKVPVLNRMVARTDSGEIRIKKSVLNIFSSVPTARLQNNIDRALTGKWDGILSEVLGVTLRDMDPEDQEKLLAGLDYRLRELEGEVGKLGLTEQRRGLLEQAQALKTRFERVNPSDLFKTAVNG